MKSRVAVMMCLIALVGLCTWAWTAFVASQTKEQFSDDSQSLVQPDQADQTTQTPAYGYDQEPYEWDDKLKRGAINIVTSPVEVAREIQLTGQSEGLASGWTVGLVKGLGGGAVRLGTGTVDLLTFPFDFPDPKKAPLTQPEYVWQKPGVKYVP